MNAVRQALPHGRLARRLLAAVAVALLTLPAACAPLNTDLGGDPCLLQQYQSHSYGNLSGLQGALGTLTQHASALTSGQAAVNSSQDVTETLTAIAEFKLTLDKQQALIATGAKPTDSGSTTFRTLIGQAIGRFRVGAQLLTQAYVDAGYADTRPASTVVAAARDWMQQGRLLISQAGVAISGLHTYSPNC